MQKYRIIRNESLKHHGILGMKWGKKNGPPYPLAPNKHSASEKKAGWQNSLNKNSPSMPQGGAAGGGGPTEEDEEDKKILEELYNELDKKNLGFMAINGSGGQDFRLTLAEFTGVDVEKLSDADVERLRKKATAHYTNGLKNYENANNSYKRNTTSDSIDAKDNFEKNNPDFELRKGKAVRRQTATETNSNSDTSKKSKESDTGDDTLHLTNKGFVKEDEMSAWDKIKAKVFGETKVSFGDAKLGSDSQENKNTHTLSEWEKNNVERIDENTIKMGNTYVEFGDASTILQADPIEFKTGNGTFKEWVSDAKDWIESKLGGNSNKKTMTFQEFYGLQNQWKAEGLTEEQIKKKIKEEYGDYTIVTPKS